MSRARRARRGSPDGSLTTIAAVPWTVVVRVRDVSGLRDEAVARWVCRDRGPEADAEDLIPVALRIVHPRDRDLSRDAPILHREGDGRR